MQNFKSFIRVLFFSSFIFLIASPVLNLAASNFSDSKQEIMAILESPQLEALLCSNQSLLGVFKNEDTYWVWCSTFRYEVSLIYSPEGQIEVAFLPGIKIIH